MIRGVFNINYSQHKQSYLLKIAFLCLLFFGTYTTGKWIAHGTWNWFAGIPFLLILYFVVWQKQRFEVGIILFLAVTIFFEFGYRATSWITYGISTGFGFIVLLVVMGIYGIQRGIGIFPAYSSYKRSSIAQWIVGLYLLFFLIASILQGDILSGWNKSPLNIWIFYGLMAVLIFSFMRKAIINERSAKTFFVLLMLMGFVLSLSDNFIIVFNKPLIPFVIGVQDLDQSVRLFNRVGLTSLRPTSIFGQIPFSGAFMSAMLAIGIVLFIIERKRLLKLLFFTINISLLINIISYADRGTWVATGFSIFILLFLLRKRFAFYIYIVALFFVGLFLIVSLTELSWHGGFSGPIDFFNAFIRSVRPRLWLNTILAIVDLPLLSGIGLGPGSNWDFALLISSHGSGYGSMAGSELFIDYVQPHNSYLSILFHMGLPCFVILISLLIYLVFKAFIVIHRSPLSETTTNFLIAALVGLIAFCTESLFDRTILVRSLYGFFWVLLGTLNALTCYLDVKSQSNRHILSVR